jgi:hypothetical protein
VGLGVVDHVPVSLSESKHGLMLSYQYLSSLFDSVPFCSFTRLSYMCLCELRTFLELVKAMPSSATPFHVVPNKTIDAITWPSGGAERGIGGADVGTGRVCARDTTGAGTTDPEVAAAVRLHFQVP